MIRKLPLAGRALVCCALATPLRASSQVPVVQFRLVQEMRIDGEAESLVGFARMLVGADGRMVLPQPQDAAVRVYDANGRRVGSFGRRGAGPGEFNWVQGTMGWHGDTLWIYDFNQRRATLVSRDLRLISTTRVVDALSTAAPAGRGPMDIPRILRLDNYYADGSQLAKWAFGPIADAVSGLRTDERYVIVSATGEIVRSVASIPPMVGRVYMRETRGFFSADVPFAARPLDAYAPDGKRVGIVQTPNVSGNQGAYTVTVLRTSGDTAFSRQYTFSPIRIPAKMKTDAIDAMLARGRRTSSEGPGLGDELANKARPLIPDSFAPVNELRFGDDETTWLAVYEPGTNLRYRMLDAKGTVLGELVLPARSVFGSASRSHLWVIQFNDDNVPSVVRYRMVPPA